MEILDEYRTTLNNDADAIKEKIKTLNKRINNALTTCKFSLDWASFICSDQTSNSDLLFSYLTLTIPSKDKVNQWKRAKRDFDDLRSKLNAEITTLTKQLTKKNQRLADLADNTWSSRKKDISAVSTTNSNLSMGNFNQAINQLSKAKELLESITQITEKALDSAKSDCISKVLLLDVFCNWSEDWISELNKDKWWKYYENLSINKDTIKDTINVAKVHVEKLDKLYKEKKILDDAKKQIKRLTAYTESVFDGLSALNTANSNIEWLDKDNNILHGSIENWQAGEPVTLDISLKNKEGYIYRI